MSRGSRPASPSRCCAGSRLKGAWQHNWRPARRPGAPGQPGGRTGRGVVLMARAVAVDAGRSPPAVVAALPERRPAAARRRRRARFAAGSTSAGWRRRRRRGPGVTDYGGRRRAADARRAARPGLSRHRAAQRLRRAGAGPGGDGPAQRDLRAAAARGHDRHGRRLPEQRPHLPQRVLAVAGPALRPGPLRQRPLEVGAVRPPGRRARLLRHPLAHERVRRRVQPSVSSASPTPTAATASTTCRPAPTPWSAGTKARRGCSGA